MLKVLKYSIPLDDYFSLDLPKDAKILSVASQDRTGQMWVLVNPGNKTERRNFRLADTGQKIDDDEATLNFIGTFHHTGYVGHVFEII